MANYANSVFSPAVTESSVRLPWNNTIFPGNYVAHLNAYRDQNVQAFPGVNFFRVIGAYVVPDENPVAVGSVALQILSPDLRQDDKPRLDRPMILRGSMGGGGIGIYRIAVNTVNLKTSATDGTRSTITPAFAGDTIASGSIPVLQSALGNAGGLFLEGGEFTAFQGFAAGSSNALVKYTTNDITVSAAVGTNTLVKVNPNKEAAILVEVCFIANAPAPESDDVHLPFPTEAGQSSQ